jgi:hypothetical protein
MEIVPIQMDVIFVNVLWVSQVSLVTLMSLKLHACFCSSLVTCEKSTSSFWNQTPSRFFWYCYIVAERIELFTTKNTLLSTSYKKYIKNKDIKNFVLYISLIFCTLCHSLFLEIIKLCFILYFIGKNCEMNYVVSKDPISQLAQVIEILQAKH